MASTRVNADLLIPGRGEPIPSGTLVTEGSTIVYAGPASGAPDSGGADVVHAAVVMPGLWECHGHLAGLPPTDPLNFAGYVTEPVAVRAARSVRDVQAALAAGVTTIREMGGLGVHLAKVVDEGILRGPSIYAAGAVLSSTGGHADVHDLPLAWVTDFGHAGGEFRLCDGPAECAKAAREQLRKGAALLKLCASGGAMSVVDHPLHQQLTVAEMRAIVEVATMAERIVAAHCHGKVAMMAAIEAGVHTIEHGSHVDEEVADAMRERGVVLVPTRSIMELLRSTGNKPAHIQRKVDEIVDGHAESVSIAVERGVTIAAGADRGVTDPKAPSAWGNSNDELFWLTELGLTPLQAIEAATANGPLTVGPQAPLSGVLEPGYDADFLTLEGSPLDDISMIADPAHITGVWKDGARVR